jgi:hypothetical protein
VSVCVVHRDGWAVADSRETMGTCIMPAAVEKVCKSDSYLIATIGKAILQNKIARIVKAKGHEIDVLESVCDMMDESDYEGLTLAVSYDRKLILIDSNGAPTDLTEVDFWAIGCCQEMVLGRLLYIAESRPVTIEDAEQAIVMAAKYDNGIDARVKRFVLDRVV